jgi:hypothetical protein
LRVLLDCDVDGLLKPGPAVQPTNVEPKYMSMELFHWMLNDSTMRNALNEGLSRENTTGDPYWNTAYAITSLSEFLTHSTDSISYYFNSQKRIQKDKDMYNCVVSGNNMEIATVFYNKLVTKFKSHILKEGSIIYLAFNEYEAQRLGLGSIGCVACEPNIIQWASSSIESVINPLLCEGWNTVYVVKAKVMESVMRESAGDKSSDLSFVFVKFMHVYNHQDIKQVGNTKVVILPGKIG